MRRRPDNGTPRRSRNETETQAAAAKDTRPRLGSLRRTIMDLLENTTGLTDDDIERITGRSHQSVSAARRGLVLEGWVQAAIGGDGRTRTRLTRSKSRATIWEPGPKARGEVPDERQQVLFA